MKNSLLIFDMDNTILCSHIDFKRMYSTVTDAMRQRGLEQYICPSVAETVNRYDASVDFDKSFSAMLWQKVCEIEIDGMTDAVLEPGAVEAFAYLSRFAELAILTNNTEQNLSFYLGGLGLLPFVSFVVGRESVSRLKPFPDGMKFVMAHYSDIPMDKVATVGDALIDAAAAEGAGIKFAAYNRQRHENWKLSPYKPLLRLSGWDKASCDALLALLDT